MKVSATPELSRQPPDPTVSASSFPVPAPRDAESHEQNHTQIWTLAIDNSVLLNVCFKQVFKPWLGLVIEPPG